MWFSVSGGGNSRSYHQPSCVQTTPRSDCWEREGRDPAAREGSKPRISYNQLTVQRALEMMLSPRLA